MKHFARRPHLAHASLASALFVGVAWLGLNPYPALADPAVYERGVDPSVGFNLITWSNSSATTWENAVQNLYNAGFREVSISPLRFVNPSTGIVSEGSQSSSLSAIGAGVARAQTLGMRVTLNPFVEPTGFSQWRGYYSPASGTETTFWNSYKSYMVDVAQMAQQYGVEAMTVGTEYNSLDANLTYQDEWDTVIDAVNDEFDGQIGYASNWDHFNNGNTRNIFWENENIDFIGIDSYFPNWVTFAQADASGAYPDQSFIDLMTNVWNSRIDGLLSYAAARKNGEGMPIAFTEIGYLPQNRTAADPQEQNQQSTQPLDTAEQRMAFQGLLNALDGRGDKFEAIDIWHWSMPGANSAWDISNTLSTFDSNYQVGQFLTNYINTAVEPLLGDYNRDGVVDAADYSLWRDSFGQFVTDYGGADGNGNGHIDEGDFLVWRDHFGETLGGGAAEQAAVPEPASATLLLLAWLCGMAGWRRGAS
jgi:Glycoside Hydrolase Family 113